jgi:glycosyltransferase involved in cell wall biosynthesis
MKERAFFISDSLPNETHGGGNVTALNIVRSLQENYDLYLIVIDNKLNKDLTFCNVKIFKKIIRIKKDKSFFLKILDFLFLKTLNNQLNNFVNKYKPELIFCYGFDAMLSCHRIKNIKKIASLGDPIYLPIYFRAFYLAKNYNLIDTFNIIKLYTLFLIKYVLFSIIFFRIRSSFFKIGAFAAHHAQNDYKCEYFRTPIQNQIKIKKKLNNIFTIAHVGHMHGTVTMDSINNLVFNIAPMLKKKYKGKIKIFLIGKFFNQLPINIRKEVNYLGIFENIGHVQPINNILSKCHALLVCNEINLGIRVRILTAMAEGVPIISHSSNAFGIPELKNNYNCLIGNNSRQLLNACDIIFRNYSIANYISKNAYTTYKKLFSILNFKHYLN